MDELNCIRIVLYMGIIAMKKQIKSVVSLNLW